jgi:hypothetical protein
MPACLISVLEGLKGESAIYAPFEDGGAQALTEAAEALGAGLVDLAVVAAADSPDEPSSLAETAFWGHLRPAETASAASAALVLARRGEGGYPPGQGLARLKLSRVQAGEARDPLAALIGRTMAAAPVILALLAATAPELRLPTEMVCSQGHRLSFEAVGP